MCRIGVGSYPDHEPAYNSLPSSGDPTRGRRSLPAPDVERPLAANRAEVAASAAPRQRRGICIQPSYVLAGRVDHRGEVFGHARLFVADGSLYPRAPGIGPSMTIAALAERQATLMD